MSSPLQHEPTSRTGLHLDEVRARVVAAAIAAGRAASDVTLIAVSKTFGAIEIEPALAAGQRVFGENRVQEAKSKWPSLRAGRASIELHLVGPLQTNKAREAVALFDVIETLDRPKLAAALAAEMARAGKRPRLFVEVNTGAEPQKAGVLPTVLPAFVGLCRAQHGLAIAGLMCIPPVEDDPARHFRLLAALARQVDVHDLSMGMSGDFEIAIAAGATHVRVGSAIFGGRG